MWSSPGPRTGEPPLPGLQAHLAFDEHVEELVPGLLEVAVTPEVPQVVVGDTQSGQAAHAGPLVVQPAALGAGNEVEELLGLGGGFQRGLGCGAQGVRPWRLAPCDPRPRLLSGPPL